MEREIIDVAFDFTKDTPGYWDHFWERRSGLGIGGNDPDALSPTLQRYHQILWSRPLPNGETMHLTMGQGYTYLTWKDFRFGSDSITASFRYKKYNHMIKQLERSLPNYKDYMENFLRKSYTIGGTIIFPKRKNGINGSRGCNAQIKDRWDLTLECIRRYYSGINSPLSEVMEKEKAFFDLFIDFRGYVDFFFLQDCVDDNYSSVRMWLPNEPFIDDPLPITLEDYFKWIEYQLTFVECRNARIADYCIEKSPAS